MPVKNLIVILFAAIVSLVCYETAQRNRYAATFVEALEIVEQEALEQYDQRELFNAAMNGMLAQIDEHSAFIDPEAYPAFQEDLNQEFAGIGITASIDPRTKELIVLSPTVGSPAYKAGLQAGDVIAKVNGELTDGWNLEKSVETLRGKPGTKVALTLRRVNEEEPIEVTITRQIILIDSVLGDTRNSDGSWNFFLEGHPYIGYVRLTSFGERSTSELRDTLQAIIPNCDALILDLRDNAGGLLGAAVDIADMFLDGGQPIVSTRGRQGTIREEYSARGDRTLVPPQMPVVVLTNRFSASASEILAACLQDHDRAIVIGERSWGKGTVQNVIELENGRSVMKLTTASYWRPSGKNIHRRRDMTEDDDWGVRPNPGMAIDLTTEQYQTLAAARRKRDYPDALSDDRVSANDPAGKAGENEASSSTTSLVENESPDEASPTADGPNGDGPTAVHDKTEFTPENVSGSDVLQVDPHLQRAIEVINQRLGRSVVTAP